MYLFVLGAQDPEMLEIENLLSNRGIEFQHAKIDGKRINPRSAYEIARLKPIPGKKIVYVECGPSIPWQTVDGEVAIDHHHPSQPEANFPPEKFWEGSSIGQTYKFLDIKEPPTKKQLLAAALDHCLNFSYRGLCPGVDPKDVYEQDVTNVAHVCGGDRELVKKNIQKVAAEATNSPTVVIGGHHVFDTRGRLPIGTGYDLHSLCLGKAAARFDLSLLGESKDTDGKLKLVLYSGKSNVIKEFMTNWAKNQNLIGIYGAPERGYAGGYIS